MKIVEGDMTKNCLRKYLDWVLEKMFIFLTELLIGICSLPVALAVEKLTLTLTPNPNCKPSPNRPSNTILYAPSLLLF